MSTVRLTVEERAALLRAARHEMDAINEDVIRLHTLNGHGHAGSENRRLADVRSDELVQLAGAVRKLWVSSFEG